MNGFHVKAKNERFTAPGSRFRQNLTYENSRRHLVDVQDACFFPMQPIKSLICGVVIGPVVQSPIKLILD